MTGTGSDRPVPRLSNQITRPKDAIRRSELWNARFSQAASRCETQSGNSMRSGAPVPNTWYAM
jgi:hypothetical protein